MQPISSTRRGFTMTDFVVLLIVVGSFQLVLASGIDAAREAARRTQCSNNLHQLSIAVHLYADQNSEQFPPSSSDFAHWSWTYYLLPGMERGETHDAIQRGDWAGSEKDWGLGGTNASVAGEFRMPTFLCPSRRTRSEIKAWWVQLPAQGTDYAAVLGGASPQFYDGNATGCIIWRAQPPDTAKRIPLRSRTTLGSCIDGLSNTMILGEKYIRPKQLNDPAYEQAALVGGAGGYLRLFHGRILGGFDITPDSFLGLHRGLPYKKDQEPGAQVGTGSLSLIDDWSFGSWHRGACLFARGDSSVASVSDRADARVLSLLGGRNDRQAVEFPVSDSRKEKKPADFPKTYPATGTLTFADGKVPPGVSVVLIPTTDDAKHRPLAAVGMDGKFSLSTFKAGDGAPLGEYKVVLHFDPLSLAADLKEPKPSEEKGAAPPLDDIASGKVFDQPPPFSLKYASALITPLEATVSEEGAKNNYSFELESAEPGDRVIRYQVLDEQ